VDLEEGLILAFFYGLGSAILISELFLPAHGLLGAVGLGMLGYGLYRTFLVSEVAGLAGLAVLAVVLPVGLVMSVRYWHRTPVGRRISPPNPRLRDEDRMPIEPLAALIGRRGRSLTPLRPVGICEFDGRRVECKAEHAVIEAGEPVEAVRLADRTLCVRAVPPEAPRPDA